MFVSVKTFWEEKKIVFVYLTMNKNKPIKFNYVTPGKEIKQKKFEQMIKKAENGPFHTIKEVKIELEKWKIRLSR
jgi:hypothetical protein